MGQSTPAEEPDDYDLWLEVLMQEPSFQQAYDDAQRREQARRDAIARERNAIKQPTEAHPLTFRQFLWRERWLFLAAALSFVAVSYGSSWLMVQLNAPYYARFLVGGAVGFLLYRTAYAILERRLRRWQ